ncbi:MAG: 50S ribosomal protein L29 [Candidatus Thermoplasmatota archaeon]|jgi:large subunit ribosomal protein L29|nr:50S ribosomal protein L29 [Candidatus Thermoplasmatota archaeon]MDP7264511.1 50S ribosomal protein L29 [Candidatus Thermoplasmatota archaeon]
MSVLKGNEIRAMKKEEKIEKLEKLRNELMYERGVAAMGGAPASPGKIRALRSDIARLLTIMREEGER